MNAPATTDAIDFERGDLIVDAEGRIWELHVYDDGQWWSVEGDTVEPVRLLGELPDGVELHAYEGGRNGDPFFRHDAFLHRGRTHIAGTISTGGGDRKVDCLACSETLEVGRFVRFVTDARGHEAHCNGCSIHLAGGWHTFKGPALSTSHPILGDFPICTDDTDGCEAVEETDTMKQELDATDESAPPCGIVHDMDAAHYHADPGIGSSPLRTQHAKSHRAARQPVEETEPMRVGTLVHMAYLEPEVWQAEVLDPDPPVELAKKTHRKAARLMADGATLEDFFEEWSYKASTIRGYWENEGVRQMADFLEDHPYADTDDETVELVESVCEALDEFMAAGGYDDDVLAEADFEVSIFWEDAETGRRCKGRIDILVELEEGLLVLDLKVTGSDVRPHAWKRRIARYSSHVQAGHYLRGLEQLHQKPVVGWHWLTVERDAPYHVKIHSLSRWVEMDGEEFDQFELCKAEAAGALADYHDHLAHPDKYDGYDVAPAPVELPSYAFTYTQGGDR